MEIIKGSLLSLIIFSLSNVSSGDCTLENFVGTWKGKVEYQGDELAQGPFVFEKGENAESLQLTDENGVQYEVSVDECVARVSVEEDGMSMKTTYTYEDGRLTIFSLVEFPDGDGNVVKSEMKGSLERVD